jgi:hypothetical protein
MKTTINNVEITPEIIEILKRWYTHENPEDETPVMYVKWIGSVQDYLTRVWVDKDDDEDDIPELKRCVNCLIQIKDDLESFIRKTRQEGGKS